MKKRLLQVLKPLFGIALLVLVARQIDVAELRQLLTRDDPLRLSFAFAAFFAALCIFQALRLHLLVEQYTSSARASWKLFFIGAFFNNLLPSNVGGDAVRLMYLRKLTGGTWAGPLSMLMLHRVSGLLMMMLLFGLYALIFPKRLWDAAARLQLRLSFDVRSGDGWLWAISAALFVLGVLLITRTSLGRRLLERARSGLAAFYGALRALPRRAHIWLFWLTVLFHGARMLGFYWVVAAFGESIAPLDLVPVLTFTAAMALLPVTVGGLGVVEGSVTVGLRMFGVSPTVAVAAALLHRFVLVVVALLGGVVYAWDRGRERAAAVELSPRERIG